MQHFLVNNHIAIILVIYIEFGGDDMTVYDFMTTIEAMHSVYSFSYDKAIIITIRDHRECENNIIELFCIDDNGTEITLRKRVENHE